MNGEEDLMMDLFDQFEEAICATEKYSKCSAKYKDDATLSKMYIDMANSEMTKAAKFHEVIISKASKGFEEGEAEKILKAMWSRKQNEMLEMMGKAKYRLSSSR